jgi:hypothetical protein
MSSFVTTLQGIVGGCFDVLGSFLSSALSVPFMAFFLVGMPVVGMIIWAATALIGRRG